MHSSPCSSVLSTSAISYQMNTCMWAICWRACNALMQANKLPWPVFERTTAQMECAMISKRRQPIYCHTTQWPRRAAATQNKHGFTQISSVELVEESVKGEVSSTTMPKKASIGKMGVHLRYHMPAEYDDLSNEQRMN